MPCRAMSLEFDLRLVRATKKKRLKGVFGIREITATAGSTPVTINNSLVRIRLRRR